ncbi:MAG: ATP-binding protein [Pseudomonadota bacterium]
MPSSTDALLGALPLPALAINSNERIEAANPAALALLGEGILERHFITALRQPALVEAVEACLQDDVPRKETYLSGEANTDVTYDVHVAPTGTGLVLLTLQDTTQMHQAGQMRRDFVANVSHELRTPLTSLMGFIETLRGPAKDDPAAQQRFLTTMSAEADRMNRLVADLLSLSRVESQGRIRPTTAIELAPVLTATLRNLNPLAVEADVIIEADIPKEPLHVLGDADQLLQVFTNLVENAIRYGATGQRVRVAARAALREAALRAPAVRIEVQDFGPGIDPQHLPRLTERFYRADSHRSRALGGTGLGLAIVKHILNRHRGRLKIASEPGQGATFTAILPLADADPS